MSAVTILQGDCLKRLTELPSGSFDAVIADPPYGTTQNAWDSIIPLEPLWSELWRVCRGPVIMTASQPFTTKLGASQIQHLRYSWVWDKVDATSPLNAKRRPMPQHEDILVFSRSATPYNPQGLQPFNKMVKNGATSTNYGANKKEQFQEFTNYPRSIIRFKRDSDKRHPTQKPVALFEYLVRTYTNEGDNILDFSAGSGTTGVAAINTGRRATLIELNPEYVALATARIAKAGESNDLRPVANEPETDLFG